MSSSWRSLIPLLAILLFGCSSSDPPADEVCDGSAPQCGLEPAVCPPPAPHGHDVGDRAANLSLADCDGGAVELHDLCGSTVAMVVAFYGWCPGCHRHVQLAAELELAYGPEKLRAMVVVVEDTESSPATPQLCQLVVEAFSLAPPLTTVIDPSSSIEAFGRADLVMLLDRDGELIFKREDATDAAIVAAIDQELGTYD